MTNELFSRDLPSENLSVTPSQRITSFLIVGDMFKATYEKVRKLPDGTELPDGTFSVDRSLSVVDLSALIGQLTQAAEQFRQDNEDNQAAAKAAADAEAARWAALTPDQQKAEVDAARAARQAAIDADIAKNGLPDPNPSGVVSVGPTPITPAPLTP